MGWLDLVPILSAALARFEQPVDPTIYEGLSGPALVERLFDMDTETRPQLDKAAQLFASSQTWPPLTNNESMMMAMRLSCAADLMNVLTLPDHTKPPLVVPATDSQQRLLTWLLTETWDWRSDHWLKARAWQLSYGGNLYR